VLYLEPILSNSNFHDYDGYDDDDDDDDDNTVVLCVEY